jgi:hypothetical protein
VNLKFIFVSFCFIPLLSLAFLVIKTMNPKKVSMLSVLGVVFLLLALPALPLVSAAGVPFAIGDVFVGIGGGQVAHYNPSGTLLDTLVTTTGSSEDTGMCFQANGNLLTTNWNAPTYGMSQFDNNGNLLNKYWVAPSTFSGGHDAESCVVDNSGNVYVGATDNPAIYEFSSTGTLLNTFHPNPSIYSTYFRGMDWIDLASDQCTIYYNGEGSAIGIFNVCTNSDGPVPFATGLSAPCFALRILSDSSVLTACSSGVYHLSNTGTILHFYDASTFSPAEYSLFALNIDPDGTSFWTAGYGSGNIYHIDIASGTQLGEFNAPHSPSVAGLAIYGEVTQGCTTSCNTQGVPQFGTGGVGLSATLLIAAVALVGLTLLTKGKRSSTIVPPLH